MIRDITEFHPASAARGNRVVEISGDELVIGDQILVSWGVIPVEFIEQLSGDEWPWMAGYVDSMGKRMEIKAHSWCRIEPAGDPPGYASRVRQLEAEGLTTSDAQGVADVEFRTV